MYEVSFTNIFTSKAVHAIAGFNPKAGTIIAMIKKAYPENSGLARFEAEGLMRGDQPLGGRTKRIVWYEESFDNLKKHFEIVHDNRPAQSASA